MADVLIILSRYQKNMQSDSTRICDIHQQLNNIKVCHIYIFNITEYNYYSLNLIRGWVTKLIQTI